MDKKTYLKTHLEHLRRLSTLTDDKAAREGFRKIIHTYEDRYYAAELEETVVAIARCTQSRNSYDDPGLWIDRLSKLEASRTKELEGRR